MTEEWIINTANFGITRFHKNVIDRLCEFRQLKNNQLESGGVLIGKHLSLGNTILVDDITTPQQTDKQERHSYYRSEIHSEIIHGLWEQSNGHSTYVGLWHTHPEPYPNFSLVDRKDWLTALKNSHYEGSKLFFIIVGQKCIRCWGGIKKK